MGDDRTIRAKAEDDPRELAAAQAGDERAFTRLVAPHRPGVHQHCYRMLGDVHDADDALQETMARAWRHLSGFEPRSPFRSWLYRIATNVCFTQLESRSRQRQMEIPLSPDPGAVETALAHMTPYAEPPDDPAAQLQERESLQLAFVAAGQLLPPRQRAVLLLRDVLGFHAAEVAGILDTSVPAVNSALQRARATIEDAQTAAPLARPHRPHSASAERELTERFATALQDADIPGLVALLSENALLTMPPQARRVHGPAAIGEFLARGPLRTARYRALPTTVNQQPAFALYRIDRTGSRPSAVVVLAIDGDRIASLTRFATPELFARLQLPPRPLSGVI